MSLLNKKEGIKIKFEDVKAMVAEGGSIGRPHIAKAITIKNVKTEQLENIDVDYILVNYGNIAEQNKFPFKLNCLNCKTKKSQNKS